MAGIEFVKLEKKDNYVVGYITAVFMVLLSSYHAVFSVFKFQISFSIAVFTTIAAAGVGYGLFFAMRKKKAVLAVFLPVFIFLVFLFREGSGIYINRYLKLWNLYYNTGYKEIDYDGTSIENEMLLFLFQLAVSIILYAILIKKKYWYIAILIMVGAVCLDSTVGYMPSTTSGLELIFSSFFYFTIYHRKGTTIEFSGIARVAVIFAVLCMISLAFYPKLDNYKKKSEYTQMKQKLTDIQNFDPGQWLVGFIEGGTNYASSGVGKGDLENAVEFSASGKRVLSVTTNHKPEESVYLRAFIGCDYDGKEWKQVEAKDFLQIESFFETENQFKKLINEPFNKLSAYSHLEKYEMNIEVLNASKDYGYSPYYSAIGSEEVYLDTCALGGGKNSHQYNYYDSKEAKKSYERVEESIAYGWSQYEDFARERYAELPYNLTELNKKCETFDNSFITSVSKEIDDWFKELSYTYHPGQTQDGEDFVEDFLFNRKTGFCVHFASAAALIYRICGYPSRYVEGYVVSPDKFIEQDDGTYKAVITDYGAHAWCETFDEIWGWQVREHTIGYDNTRTGNGETRTQQTTTTGSEETTTIQESGSQQTSTQSNETLTASSGGVVNNKTVNKALKTIFAVIFLVVIGAAVLVIPQRVRRIRKIRKIKGKNSICSTYNEVCRICNYMGGNIKDLYAADALEKMIVIFPQLSENEWRWMYNTALKTAFSKEHTISSEDNRRMYLLYRKFRNDMLRQMKGIKKFVFLFIKAM